jgi:hypothetical protein
MLIYETFEEFLTTISNNKFLDISSSNIDTILNKGFLDLKTLDDEVGLDLRNIYLHKIIGHLNYYARGNLSSSEYNYFKNLTSMIIKNKNNSVKSSLPLLKIYIIDIYKSYNAENLAINKASIYKYKDDASGITLIIDYLCSNYLKRLSRINVFDYSEYETPFSSEDLEELSKSEDTPHISYNMKPKKEKFNF